MDREKIIEILQNFEFINPELVSNGYGQFPDGYKMKKGDVEELATKIWLDQSPEDEDYMTKRKIIRSFVRWQLENDMIDSLTIDYEVAEAFLEEDMGGEVPDLSGLDDDSKKQFIEDFVKMATKNVLSVFVSLGLESHMEVKVINDVNGDEFLFSFKKV